MDVNFPDLALNQLLFIVDVTKANKQTETKIRMNFENTGLLSSTDGAFVSEIHWPPKLQKVKLTIHTSNYRVPYFAYVGKSQHNLLLILYIKLQLG